MEPLQEIISRLDRIITLLEAKGSRGGTKAVKAALPPLVEQIQPYRGSYPPREIEKFLIYWSESNARGKQLWETKPTWQIAGRLRTWMMNVEDKDFKATQRLQLKQVEEKPREKRDWQEEPYE